MQSADQNKRLADIGLDSLMAIEVKQIIERQTDVVLTVKEIRTLTFSDLARLQKDPTGLSGDGNDQKEKSNQKSAQRNALPTEAFVKMRSKDSDYYGPALFLLFHHYGTLENLEHLVSHLKCDVYGFQFTEQAPTTTMEELAKYYVQVYITYILYF